MEGSDWLWTDCPGRLLPDRTLSACLDRTGRALLRRDLEGFCLAFPYSPQEPFPIPPLFCLARRICLSGRWWVAFRFTRSGRPQLFSEDGEV